MHKNPPVSYRIKLVKDFAYMFKDEIMELHEKSLKRRNLRWFRMVKGFINGTVKHFIPYHSPKNVEIFEMLVRTAKELPDKYKIKDLNT